MAFRGTPDQHLNSPISASTERKTTAHKDPRNPYIPLDSMPFSSFPKTPSPRMFNQDSKLKLSSRGRTNYLTSGPYCIYGSAPPTSVRSARHSQLPTWLPGSSRVLSHHIDVPSSNPKKTDPQCSETPIHPNTQSISWDASFVGFQKNSDALVSPHSYEHVYLA